MEARLLVGILELDGGGGGRLPMEGLRPLLEQVGTLRLYSCWAIVPHFEDWLSRGRLPVEGRPLVLPACKVDGGGGGRLPIEGLLPLLEHVGTLPLGFC